MRRDGCCALDRRRCVATPEETSNLIVRTNRKATLLWGRVVYTYGHSSDRPISVISMNYADHAVRGSGYSRLVEAFAIFTICNYVGENGPSVAEMVIPSTDPRASCSPRDAKAGHVCTSSLIGFPDPRTSL
jgi:hypothetical protein